MDILSSFVQQIIGHLYSLTVAVGMPSYGLAIILLTILIKLILYPLTAKQIASTKAMTNLQPKMKALQEKYKDDKATLNQKLSELYKEEGINPLAGCLPLLVQMPILIGIFYGIRDFQYAGPSSFLWMSSIADKDPYYILPVLSALTTFIQSKQTLPATSDGGAGAAQGKVMMYFMPLFIGYISIDFPAGLVLYWVVMNIMQILQQLLMDRNKAKAEAAAK